MDHDYCKPISTAGVSDKDSNSVHCQIHGNKLAQEMVRNVYRYFVEQHEGRSPLQETAKALKISVPSVMKYRDGPKEDYKPVPRKYQRPVTDIREGLQAEIRNEIYNMYAAKLSVTMKSLQNRLAEKQIFDRSKSSLRRILKNIGFSYKRDDNRRALTEKPHVSMLRREFLKKYMENELLGPVKKPYVFLDETWVFANGSFRKSWQDDDVRSVRKTSGEGNRFIVLHAGTASGFVNNAFLIFKSKQNIGDYHGEMNAENFEKWLKYAFLPSLEEPSIILLDNASYHSRQQNKWPVKSWRKGEMQDWLRANGIAFSLLDTIPRLWTLISEIPRTEKSYAVDNLIREAGHDVIRLPPYHCQFNAIEMVWSQAKRFYDDHIGAVKNVMECWEMALNRVTVEQWSNYVIHTDKVIKEAWEREKDIMVTIQEPIVIHVSDSDCSLSDDD